MLTQWSSFTKQIGPNCYLKIFSKWKSLCIIWLKAFYSRRANNASWQTPVKGVFKLEDVLPNIYIHSFNNSSVQSFSHVQILATPWLQHARLLCPSPAPVDCSNSCPSSWWCHPTISSSVVCFSFCLRSFPVSGSFQISQFFASGGQNIGGSASASVLPLNIQDWFPIGLTGLISLQSKGLSRVSSNKFKKVTTKFVLNNQMAL